MKKTLKILTWVIGTLVALLVLAVLILPFVFDPNQYKGNIAQAVKDATGRGLKIDGKIGWTGFPRLGITVGRVEFGNERGFGPEPMATVESATVRVALLPLLSKHIDVDTVIVDGLTLNLAKNASGGNNWEGLTQAKAAPAKEKAPGQPA